MEYIDFLKTKKTAIKKVGFEVGEDEMNAVMFDFQRYCVKKALSAGKYALFEDCGLGKTLQQLEWAKKVAEHTGKPVLILAPLGVIRQTICEGDTVLTPFLGIGSEVHQAIMMRRFGVGFELKESYFNEAVKNCKGAEIEALAPKLFDVV